MKILIAIDGSKAAALAVKSAIDLAKAMTEAPTLVLMHADVPLMRRVAAELGTEGTRRYHQENHDYAMKAARTALKRAKLAFSEKQVVDDAGPAIVKAAKAGKFDLVVMGSHGRTALASALLGSVAAKVLSHSTVPVLIVR
ncbi:universal stress protein [Arenimonas soli]|uniref:Universal stress protein n=1 Tax=Arenimonas soli TaxID=2269504 RepID=A0ABQ1HNX8_9GAMM|nr:universal stress protein [Arenimonas soli]GGA83640.1 universal stress protein [Arenimonas soli]